MPCTESLITSSALAMDTCLVRSSVVVGGGAPALYSGGILLLAVQSVVALRGVTSAAMVQVVGTLVQGILLTVTGILLPMSASTPTVPVVVVVVIEALANGTVAAQVDAGLGKSHVPDNDKGFRMFK